MIQVLRKIHFHQFRVTPFSSALIKYYGLYTHLTMTQLYVQRIVAFF